MGARRRSITLEGTGYLPSGTSGVTMIAPAEPAKKMVSIDESSFDARYGHHVYLHEGVAYTPDMTAAAMRSIVAFPMDPRDVCVVGYPKSGTNWVAIILARLYPYWGSTRFSASGRVPDLHVPSRPAIGFEGLGEALSSPPPRLLKTHSRFSHMPHAFRDRHVGRAVYITRNPKDVCDSYFGQLGPWLPTHWSWERHVQAFIAGHVFFGSWLENVLSWHARRDSGNVLHLSYEQMRRDPRAAVERIVAFVGPDEASDIDRVVAETGFEAMQKGELRERYQPQMVRRAGLAGGWRKRFTAAQSEAMDHAFAAALRAAGIEIDYGD